MLHRLDNVVQLAHDDPEPFPKKMASSVAQPIKPLPLALPQSSHSAPPPPKASQQAHNVHVPKTHSKPITSTSECSKPPSSSPPQASHSDSNQVSGVSRSKAFAAPSTVPPSSEASQARHNSSDASTSSSNLDRTQARDRRTTSSSSLTDDNSTNTSSAHLSLALPSKKRDFSTFNSSSQNLPPQTFNPQSHLVATSPASDLGPLRVAQPDEIEEFDFVDSPPDPDPVPQPAVAPSPLALPSPAPAQAPVGSYPTKSNQSNLVGTANSSAGRPTLSRSPSVADNGTVTGSPLTRQNTHYGLALPTPPTNRPSLASPAYPLGGLSRSANRSNQPTAPSPLQSVVYSSSSSPEDRVQSAATPMLVSVSPASLTVTNTESTAGQGGPNRRCPLPSSNGISGRSGVSSPIPPWQYTQHLQQSVNGGSPLRINDDRSPAPLTNHNLAATSNAPPISHRTYQRSDSGSSVRESDTDSEDEDDEDDESSEEEEGYEPVPPASQPVELPPVVEPLRDSEQDAEAEDDDEDDEYDLQNFATELEASMLIENIYGAKVGAGPYGLPEADAEDPPVPPAKGGKSKKKTANALKTANTTTRKTAASKAKSKASRN